MANGHVFALLVFNAVLDPKYLYSGDAVETKLAALQKIVRYLTP